MSTKPTFVSGIENVVRFWDMDKNAPLLPSTTRAGSNKKVWWQCDKGHSYRQVVTSKTRKNPSGCPICTNKQLLQGYNDAATVCPDIVNIWDADKNLCTATEVLYTEGKKRFFRCDKGHSFTDTIRDRIKKKEPSLCPYCSNKKLLTGFNDVSTVYTDNMKQWDWDKNIVSPSAVLFNSHTKVWWLCDKGHSYSQTPSAKIVHGHSCPYCSNHKVLSGYNDVKTLYPLLAQQWDSKKNDKLPSEVMYGSAKKVWWICDKGHSFCQEVRLRTQRGHGCPVCNNSVVSAGDNDILSTHSHLMKQWDDEKNTILPSEVTYGSKKKVWWRCEKGHSYQFPIKYKSQNVGFCPECRTHGVSEQEKELRSFVRSVLEDSDNTVDIVFNTKEVIFPYELDIYIPDKKIAIEYNGLFWHSEQTGKDKNYHKNKWEACHDKGVQLIAVWEDDWRDRKDIVKSMLAHKLGVDLSSRVFARKTEVKPVDSATARKFCDSYHIQGFANGTVYLGLYNKADDTLVALSIWRKNKKDIYLDRYCTSQTVVGGFSKLLAHAKALLTQDGFDRIVTFADNSVSNGGMYARCGFMEDSILRPDYSYVYQGRRYHKFGFRKHKFKSNPDLLYREGLTEKQLAELNGLFRVWDYGKKRYVFPLK